MKKNGVDLRKCCLVDKIITTKDKNTRSIAGVQVNGREIRCKAILSNASIKNTVQCLVGPENFPQRFVEEADKVRINSSSCQVYMGVKRGEKIPFIGDLVFYL